MPEAITADYLESFLGNRRLAEQLAFILEVEKLKTVMRKTPLLDRSRVENDAEHTWQLALMAMVLSEHSREPVDLLRVIKMLLIHDIVEIDAGDTFAYDSVGRTSQVERELKAADRSFALLPDGQAQEFRALWDEFERKATEESRFANAMDRLQPLLHNFFTSGGTWSTHGVTASDVDRRMAPIGFASETLGGLASSLLHWRWNKGFLHRGWRLNRHPKSNGKGIRGTIMLTIKRPSLDDAKILIQGASAKAVETGTPMCITIHG